MRHWIPPSCFLSSIFLHCAVQFSLVVASSDSVASRSSSQSCARSHLFVLNLLCSFLMCAIQSSSSSSVRLVVSSVSLSHDTLLSGSCPMPVLFLFLTLWLAQFRFFRHQSHVFRHWFPVLAFWYFLLVCVRSLSVFRWVVGIIFS